MKKIVESTIIKSFSKYVTSYDRHAQIQKSMGERLVGFLPTLNQLSILEIGCGTGLFTRHLLTLNPKKLIINDLAPAMIKRLEEQYTLPSNVKILIGNAEKKSFPRVDLIAANAVFQWFNSPSPSLKHLGDFLKPNGKLLFSTFGPQTLKELREIARIASPTNLLTHSHWKKIINEAGLEIEEVQNELKKVIFPSSISLIKNLQRSGTAPKRLLETGRLRQIIRQYGSGFSTAQGVYSTWEMFYFLARKSN